MEKKSTGDKKSPPTMYYLYAGDEHIGAFYDFEFARETLISKKGDRITKSTDICEQDKFSKYLK